MPIYRASQIAPNVILDILNCGSICFYFGSGEHQISGLSELVSMKYLTLKLEHDPNNSQFKPFVLILNLSSKLSFTTYPIRK